MGETKQTVLIVDDEPMNIEILKTAVAVGLDSVYRGDLYARREAENLNR